MTYNCGGLSSGTYQEILVWLKQEAEQGRPIDIACVQETAWREDFEFRTSWTASKTLSGLQCTRAAQTGRVCFVS